MYLSRVQDADDYREGLTPQQSSRRKRSEEERQTDRRDSERSAGRAAET